MNPQQTLEWIENEIKKGLILQYDEEFELILSTPDGFVTYRGPTIAACIAKTQEKDFKSLNIGDTFVYLGEEYKKTGKTRGERIRDGYQWRF